MSVVETTNSMRVKDVLDHHLKSFGEGDLKGILSDYAPDAVLFTAGGPLKGADAIRSLFQAMITEFGKPGAAFSMQLPLWVQTKWQRTWQGAAQIGRASCRERV